MLPLTIQTFWLNQFVRRNGAYLALGADGLMASKGGHLGAYGLGQLNPIRPLVEQFDLLLGLFPWEEPLRLPFVELADTIAEVELWKAEGLYWLVLLEVSEAALVRQAWHQSVNAMALEER
jgi:hypothetical protein